MKQQHVIASIYAETIATLCNQYIAKGWTIVSITGSTNWVVLLEKEIKQND